MKNFDVRRITGLAIILAIELIFESLGNLIVIGPVNLNLSLIPVAIGAIVYGPLAGAFLGLSNGVFVILTDAFFMPYCPLQTILVCLVKCTLAGYISGLTYKVISKRNTDLATIISSLLVPVINTLIFAIACFTLFGPAIDVHSNGRTVIEYVFLGLILWNFIFEFITVSVLTPSIVKIRKIMTRSNKHAL